MRIGPLRSYAPSIRRKLLLGAVSSVALTTFFPGAVLAADFTQSKYRMGVTGTEVTNPALLPGWNFSRPSVGYAEGTTNEVVTNKVTAFNANPTTTAGFIGAGVAMVTVVDDSAALAAAGLSGICTSGKVFFANNTTGANAFINIGAAPNSNAHTISAWIRSPTYTTVAMSAGLGSSTVVPITSSYTRQSVTQVAVTGNAAFIRIDANSSFYFILPQWIERGSNIPQDIVTTGAAASINYGQTQNLKLFQAGEPRITNKGLLIEEGRTNIAISSGAPGIGSGWTNISGGSSSPIDGPDGGTASAARWTDGTTSTGHRPAQSVTLASATTYTISCYVRQGTHQYIRITSASTDQVTAAFDMSTKTLSSVGLVSGSATNISAAIVRLGTTNWYRLSLTFTTSTGAGSTVLIGHAMSGDYTTASNNYTGVSAYTDFFGFQVEVGAFPSSYIPTTTAAATRAADSAYITGLGSILGQFRTNLIPYSTPTAGKWFATSGGAGVVPTVTYNAGIGPNGTQFARVQLSLGGATSNNDLSSFVTTSVTFLNGVTCTASVWLKSNTASNYQVVIAAPNSAASTVTVTPVWQRFTLPVTPSNSGTFGLAVRLRGATGSSDSADILVADAQWELGGVATDLIVSNVTATSVGNTFSVAAWADLPAIDGAARTLATMDDGSVNNRVRLSRNASNQGQFAATVAGSGQASLTANGYAGTVLLKMASRVKAASYAGVVNSVPLSTAITAPPGLNRLRLGVDADGVSNSLHGYLQSFAVYGDVDDDKLQSLTV